MRLGLAMPVLLLAAVILTPARLDRDLTSRPRIDRIEPQAAKPGTLVMAFGANLSRSRVRELILSNVERCTLTQVVEQSDISIRFRVPRTLAPGRFRVELVVAGRQGEEVVEQPVSFTVLQE